MECLLFESCTFNYECFCPSVAFILPFLRINSKTSYHADAGAVCFVLGESQTDFRARDGVGEATLHKVARSCKESALRCMALVFEREAILGPLRLDFTQVDTEDGVSWSIALPAVPPVSLQALSVPLQ